MNSEPTQTIWIARHATRIDNVDPAWKASAPRPFDPHLAEQGMLEAKLLAERLAGEAIDAVYASPFLRTVQTATAVADAVDAPLRIEPGLCEWLQDVWFDGVPTLMPDVDLGWRCDRLDASYRSPMSMKYPETWDCVMTRTAEAIARLTATRENVMLVAHGASVIGCVAALLEGSTAHQPPTPLACLYKLVRQGDGPWRAELIADVSHLDGLAAQRNS